MLTKSKFDSSKIDIHETIVSPEVIPNPYITSNKEIAQLHPMLLAHQCVGKPRFNKTLEELISIVFNMKDNWSELKTVDLRETCQSLKSPAKMDNLISPPWNIHAIRICLAIGLLMNAFSFCYAQEEFSLSKIEPAIRFKFQPNGRAEPFVKEVSTLNLPKKFALILDGEFADRMNLSELKTLRGIAQEAVSKTTKTNRDFSSDSTRRSQLLDQWKGYIQDASSRFDAYLSTSESRKIQCQIEADSFFSLGFKAFVKSKVTENQVEIELPQITASEVRAQLRAIELEVIELLLRDLSDDKRFELTNMITSSIPDRNPPMSILWRSLLTIEQNSETQEPELNVEHIYLLKSGRLTKLYSIPTDPVMNLVYQIAAIVRTDKNAGEFRDTALGLSRELYQAYEERKNDRSQELETIKEGFHTKQQIISIRKSLSESFNRDLEKLANETIEKLPTGVKEQVLVNGIMVTYQRTGFENAFFTKLAGDCLEYPLDSKDIKSVRANADEARSVLEDRVQEFLSGLFTESLSKHFSPKDTSLTWLDQRYDYQIPPVELLSSWFEEE